MPLRSLIPCPWFQQLRSYIADGTTITPGNGSIIDAQGRTITVSSDGFIYRTASVSESAQT